MSSDIGANLSRLSKGEIDLQWTWTQAFAWRIVQGKVQGGYVLNLHCKDLEADGNVKKAISDQLKLKFAQF